MNTGLLIFLLLNMFVIGVIATIALRHGLAHFRPEKHDADKMHAQTQVKLPPAVRQQLLEAAQHNFQKVLESSASQLQLDLSRTTSQLNKQLEKLGNEIVSDEMKRYRASLDELQRSTESAVSSTKDELSKHQEDLKATMAEQQKAVLQKMEAEVAAEKERLIAQIDTKLADAAASFLIETLGHNVDLGAQAGYLTSMLEAHKEDFKKEIGDETPTS